jgi:hypothetical protein
LLVALENPNTTLKQQQRIVETLTRFGEVRCRGDAPINILSTGKRWQFADDKQSANAVTTSQPVPREQRGT